MGITKSQIFTEEQNQLAQIAKVLGHPARIAILEHIMKSNACICNDLVNEIGLAQATISQHLKELKSIGIISGSIEGKSICYCIDKNKWSEIQLSISNFFKSAANCC
jgi:predicted transcriptional regulator